MYNFHHPHTIMCNMILLWEKLIKTYFDMMIIDICLCLHSSQLNAENAKEKMLSENNTSSSFAFIA